MSEMLPLPSFSLHQPESIADCVALLAEHPDSKIIAGGTDLLPSMKYGIFSPPTLVSTQRIASLKAIEECDDGIFLGAGMTHLEIQSHPLVQQHHPALATACSEIATPTLQAMGTLGGNIMLDTRCIWYNQSEFWRGALGGCLKCEGEICHVAPKGTGCYAAHSADSVPVLILLNAEVEFVSSTGTRRVPLDELYTDDGLEGPKAQHQELLTRIWIPHTTSKIAYRKLRPRGAIDYPLLLTAVRVDFDAQSQPIGGDIVLSALGPKPLRIEGVSPLIQSGDIHGAAELAWKQAMPLSTHHWASTWRKKLVRVEARKALAELLSP